MEFIAITLVLLGGEKYHFQALILLCIISRLLQLTTYASSELDGGDSYMAITI